MSMADVIALPNATRGPVLQPKRRGRLPRAIPSLARRRMQRSAAERAEAEAKAKASEELKSACAWLYHRAASGELRGLMWIARTGDDDEIKLMAEGAAYRGAAGHRMEVIAEDIAAAQDIVEAAGE